MEPSSPAPRLLDQLRHLADAHFGRPEPGARYAEWVRRFILFHGKRHPRDLGGSDVLRFLDHLAHTEPDPLGAMEQAREAVDFLDRRLVGRDPGELPLPEPPRLLDRPRYALRVRHSSPRTEVRYVEWVVRYVQFHGTRHPNTMGAPEIERFLTDLAVTGHVSASTRNQAFNALLFLDRHVLASELPWIDAVRAPAEAVARRSESGRGPPVARRRRGGGRHLPPDGRPVVRGRPAPRGVLPAARPRPGPRPPPARRSARQGETWMRGQDRIVMLPRNLRADPDRQLARRRALHDRDPAAGLARVARPDALARKYPRAAQEFGWQFLFASRQPPAVAGPQDRGR